MLTISQTKASPLARTFDDSAPGRLWSGLAKALLWPVRVIQARQLAHAFAHMDEHELADLGLTRQDVRDITGLAIDDDPSLFLAERRRAGRRGDLAHHGRIPPAWR